MLQRYLFLWIRTERSHTPLKTLNRNHTQNTLQNDGNHTCRVARLGSSWTSTTKATLQVSWDWSQWNLPNPRNIPLNLARCPNSNPDDAVFASTKPRGNSHDTRRWDIRIPEQINLFAIWLIFVSNPLSLTGSILFISSNLKKWWRVVTVNENKGADLTNPKREGTSTKGCIQ